MIGAQAKIAQALAFPERGSAVSNQDGKAEKRQGMTSLQVDASASPG